MFSTVF